MGNLTNFEAVKAQLEAIKPEDVKQPTMPIDLFIGEAISLFNAAQTDAEQLATVGITAEFIANIEVRAEALRYAETKWSRKIDSTTQAQAQWNEIAESAFSLRDELMHTFRYAFRNNSDALKTIDRIDDGAGNLDMVQDLSELANLGRDFTAELTAISFDVAKLDTADQLSDKCGKLLGRVEEAKHADKPTLDTRDRAYTYLKQAVDSVRDAGKYLFWKNPDKLERYASAYFRNKAKKAKDETSAADTE